MKRFFTIPKIVTYIIIVAAIWVFFFIKFHNNFEAYLGAEIFKYSFQFLLLIVIGGAVTLVFTTYTKQKEQRLKDKEKANEKRSECRKTQHKFHNDFIQSYNSAKLLRRLIRARARVLQSEGDKDLIVLDSKTYDMYMQELTKLQLQFEFYIDETESNPTLLPDRTTNTSFQDKVKLMRDYLNEIVAEYENCYKLFPNQYYIKDIETINLNKLPILSEFIITYEDAKAFKENFRKPANDVQKILLNILSEN